MSFNESRLECITGIISGAEDACTRSDLYVVFHPESYCYELRFGHNFNFDISATISKDEAGELADALLKMNDASCRDGKEHRFLIERGKKEYLGFDFHMDKYGVGHFDLIVYENGVCVDVFSLGWGKNRELIAALSRTVEIPAMTLQDYPYTDKLVTCATIAFLYFLGFVILSMFNVREFQNYIEIVLVILLAIHIFAYVIYNTIRNGQLMVYETQLKKYEKQIESMRRSANSFHRRIEKCPKKK